MSTNNGDKYVSNNAAINKSIISIINSIKSTFPKMINEFLLKSFFLTILIMFKDTNKPTVAVKNIFRTSIIPCPAKKENDVFNVVFVTRLWKTNPR